MELKTKKASVLLYTLLILSLITLLTQQLIKSSWIGSIFNNTAVERQQARVLALNGINLAISQLSIKTNKEDTQNKQQKEKQPKPLNNFLSLVLPNLNIWQAFELQQKLDGIDGQIKICITCENGKLNINQMFDFKKQEFKPEYKRLLKGLSIKGKIAEGEFEKRLTEFFKKRKRKLDDISELVNVEGFEGLGVFYNPPELPQKRKKAEPNKNIFLQDLFTIWPDSDKVQLLFTSDSLRQLFGLRRSLASDSQALKDNYEKFAKDFNKSWVTDWEKNWIKLQPILGAKPKTFKVYKKILSKEFGPKIYSVISCGKVKNVEQKLLAILVPSQNLDNQDKKNNKTKTKTTKTLDKEKKGQDKEKTKKESFPENFDILRFYWI